MFKSISKLSLLKQLANLADPIAIKYYESQTLNITKKPDNSPVTKADLKIEQTIRDYVSQAMPKLAVLGEEFGDSNSNATTKLIIDPIDGTRNFIRGIPFFATLLAIEENGHIVAGLISAPKTNDRWWAEKNSGAFHNGKKIQVSKIDQLNQAQAFHGSLYGCETKHTPNSFQKLLASTDRQRGFGDYYAAMLVAMGCGEFAADFGIKPWDIAPLKIIIEEAGGKVTNLAGDFSINDPCFVYSNGILHDDILKILNT